MTKNHNKPRDWAEDENINAQKPLTPPYKLPTDGMWLLKVLDTEMLQRQKENYLSEWVKPVEIEVPFDQMSEDLREQFPYDPEDNC